MTHLDDSLLYFSQEAPHISIKIATCLGRGSAGILDESTLAQWLPKASALQVLQLGTLEEFEMTKVTCARLLIEIESSHIAPLFTGIYALILALKERFNTFGSVAPPKWCVRYRLQNKIPRVTMPLLFHGDCFFDQFDMAPSSSRARSRSVTVNRMLP